MSSVYVVCWTFLQTFQTYFNIQANSVDSDQTAPRGAVWYWSTLFAKNDFKNHKQMTKQTTLVVIGALRVKRTAKAVFERSLFACALKTHSNWERRKYYRQKIERKNHSMVFVTRKWTMFETAV